MPGETSRLKLKYAEEKDERSSYPTAVDEPRARRLDEIAVAAGTPSSIATEQSRENTAFGVLAAPDEVEVVLPTNGLIAVCYQALWQSTVSEAGKAAIFLGANQLKVPGTGAPAVQETSTEGTAQQQVSTVPGGLATQKGPTSFVNTGLVVVAVGGLGGPAYIWAAAGTYKISVQFKATSGKVSVKERRLWAWVTP